jgi:YcxB-like protein
VANQLPLTIHAQLTPSELFWANISVISRQLRKFLWVDFAVIAFWVVFFLFMWFRPWPNVEWQTALRNIAPLLLVLALFPLTIFLSAHLNKRKQLADPRNAGGITFQFADSGIGVEHSTGKSDLNWTIFVKVVETRDFFLLYPVKSWAYVVPKRCLASQTEIATMRQLLQRHVPDFKPRTS